MKKNLLFNLSRFFFNVLGTILVTGSILCAQNNTSHSANSDSITGTMNTAIGVGAMPSNTGNGNTATGYQAMLTSIEGNRNTAHGFQALYNVSARSDNTAVGYQSLFSSALGGGNTAVGVYALYSSFDAGGNTACGNRALYSNLSGDENVAVGSFALYSNTHGYDNTASGGHSLYLNTSGHENTAVGWNALRSNIAGDYNTAIGVGAGTNIVGDRNICLGHNAGYSEIGSDKLYIGSGFHTIIYGDISTGQLLFGNREPYDNVFKGNRTLNVVGGILADSLRLSPVGDWADHVFSNNYDLLPLSEVKQFIKNHHHLLNIPSAAEIKKNGINVAEMNSKLLEKIEELTLYMLQQEELIQSQSKQIESQKASHDSLQKQINDLKEIVTKRVN